MKWIPHLTFNGQCEEAFRFYERCFGGKIAILVTYGHSHTAQQAPPELFEKIVHGRIELGDASLCGIDLLPEHYEPPRGTSIMVMSLDLQQVERAFRTLASEGIVQIPLHETTWALRFGMVRDQFGIAWTLTCQHADDPMRVTATEEQRRFILR